MHVESPFLSARSDIFLVHQLDSAALSKARKAKLLLSHLLQNKNKFAAAAVAEMSSNSAALIFSHALGP